MPQKQKSNNIDMVNGPLFGNIIRYAIPLMLTGVLQLLFNAADLVVVGRYCGRLSIAAVGATGAIINLIINLFIGLSVGVGVTVAVSLGAQDDDRCSRAVHTAMPVAVIGGAVLTVVGVLISRTLLSWMQTPDDVIGLSALYMRIYFCGMIPSLVFNYGAAILRAAGDTKHPLYYLVTAGIINVVLNLFFVIVLKRNVDGVALATILSQCVSAFLIVRFLLRTEGAYKLVFRKMHIYGLELKQIVKIGLPAGIQSSMFSISNVIIQSSVNSFGALVMAGNGAAASIEGFTYIAMNSVYHASLTFVGQNVGARRLDRINKVVFRCLVIVTVIGLAFGIVSYLLAEPLLAIYLPEAPDAIAFGKIRMLYIVLPYFLCGMMEVMVGGQRGMGLSLIPMINALIGSCLLRIVWIATVFAAHHTLFMLYISYPISWFVTTIAHSIVYGIKLHKLKQEDYIHG